MKIKATLSVFILFLCSTIVSAQEINAPVVNEPIKITLPDSLVNKTENANTPTDTLTNKVIETTTEKPSESGITETNLIKDSLSPDSKEITKEDSFKFSEKGMSFREWSVQLFLGQPFFYASTLETKLGYMGNIYDFQLGVTRQLNHVFAIQLLGQIGKTKQHLPTEGYDVRAETSYQAISLLGDFNLSALIRKVDFKQQKYYKWALHAYVGVGTFGYKTDGAFDHVLNMRTGIEVQKKIFKRSYFVQGAVGLRRRINQNFDVELKQGLFVTDSEYFDGSGPYSPYSRPGRSLYGNLFITSIGAHYKIGKKESEHMAWVDPFQYLIKDNKSSVDKKQDKKELKEAVKDVMKEALAGRDGKDGKDGLAGKDGGIKEIVREMVSQTITGKDGKDGAAGKDGGVKEIIREMVSQAINGKDGKDGMITALGRGGKLCDKDADNDAVCDQWDRQPNTPAGSRIDGSGVALDVDLDDVIDLYDQCVVVPGEGNPTGCPDKQNINTQIIKDKFNSINVALEGIDFDFNSDVIKPQYFTILDQAGFVMNEFPAYKFNIEGHTDSQGSDYYNYVLSKKRSESVKRYMMEKHSITADRLIIVPKGETDLKNPECKVHTNCTEDKNRENRRIVFVPLE